MAWAAKRPANEQITKQLKSNVLPGLPDVATRVDMRTAKVKFFKKYLSEGMSDPGKIVRPGR